MPNDKATPSHALALPLVADCRTGCCAIYEQSRAGDSPGCNGNDDRNIAYSCEGAQYCSDGFWRMCQDTQNNYRFIVTAVNAYDRLMALAKRYEAVEAKLVLDGDWTDDMPKFTPKILEEWMEIQSERNALLTKLEGESNE